MNTILVTGGAGFIGKRLITRLKDLDVRIKILDSLEPQIHGEIPEDTSWMKCSSIELIRGSICDRRDIQRAVEGATHIVHLASETGTGQSMYQISDYARTNIYGTSLLMDVLASSSNHDVGRVVLASSRSVYGEGAYVCRSCQFDTKRITPAGRDIRLLEKGKWDPVCERCGSALVPVPTLEDDPLHPASVYAATKVSQEDLVRITCSSIGIDHVALRFQNVYGEGQSLKNPYTGILSIFSTRLRRNLDLPIFEDGFESRDFVHVDDVVSAINAALWLADGLAVAVNVGTGIGVSILDIATKLQEIFGCTSALRVTGEYRVGDIRHNIADITKLQNVLGVNPQVDLETGLRRFLSWVETQALPVDLLHAANEEMRARKLMR